MLKKLKVGELVKVIDNKAIYYPWEIKRKPVLDEVYYICHMYPQVIYLSKNNNCKIKNLGQHDGIGIISYEECLIPYKTETYCI